MNLIKDYRPYGVRVTDLTSQLWCERQLEYSLKHGRVRTQEMQRGKDRHEDLHEEISILIEVEAKTLEDAIALKLYNCQVGLKRLSLERITRELPVWGKVNSLFAVGTIDELILEQKRLMILDTKTRRSNNLPSESQKRTTRFQLMLYKHLFDSMSKGKFTAKDLIDSYGFTKKTKITDEFKEHTDSLGITIEPNIMGLSDKVFSLIQKFPEVDNRFEIRYEYQGSNEIIGSDRFEFNSHDFIRNCNFVEEFWSGERESIPVGETNGWKCNYCEFRQMCQNNIKTLDSF